MPATRMAATGTSATAWPVAERRVRMTARSFLQNSFSTRRSAIGLTFQVSPAMYVTCSMTAVVRRVEAVIHAGGEPQRDVAPVAIGLGQLRVRQQIA